MQLYNDGMTRAEALVRRAELEKMIRQLEDQLLAVDTQSASVSSGAGSQSYTNRTTAEIKAKISYAKIQLARLEGQLGLRTPPGAIKVIQPRFG